jgi:hypothetical protein
MSIGPCFRAILRDPRPLDPEKPRTPVQNIAMSLEAAQKWARGTLSGYTEKHGKNGATVGIFKTTEELVAVVEQADD